MTAMRRIAAVRNLSVDIAFGSNLTIRSRDQQTEYGSTVSARGWASGWMDESFCGVLATTFANSMLPSNLRRLEFPSVEEIVPYWGYRCVSTSTKSCRLVLRVRRYRVQNLWLWCPVTFIERSEGIRARLIKCRCAAK